MKKNKQFFAKIPYKMIEKMTGTDIKYYGALFLHCFGAKKYTCIPGIERISMLTGIKSTATLAKAQKNHVKAGWIEEVRHRYKNSNEYKIKKVNKQYAEIPEPALLLSNTTLKLYCYLTKKCKDTETTITTATIKKESGITDNRTLYPALIELHDNDLLDFPSFVCSKQIHKWKIVKTNPAKTKDPLDKNPAKSKEQENTNSAKTKDQPLQKVKGNPAKTKDKRNSFKINFFERDYIMQDGVFSFLKTGQEKTQEKTQEKEIIPIEHKEEDSSQKNKKDKIENKVFPTKQKKQVSLSNKQRRKIRKKYKESVFDTDRNCNSFFTVKEFAMLLDKYDNLSEDEKEKVNEYVAHEILLYDIDPAFTEKETKNLINIFRCEYLVPENKKVPERTIIRNYFKQMSKEQRQAEIDNDLVVKGKLNKIEERKKLGVFDIDDLMKLSQHAYEKFYDKGKGIGAQVDSRDDVQIEDEEDENFDMLAAFGETG